MNRCTAVIDTSTNMAHITQYKPESNSKPTQRTTIRSALSMRPPLACNPSDSALARWYEMSDDTAITAKGKTAAVPPRVEPRYHATPPNMKESAILSMVESKNAPRWLETLDAFAKAPSSMSGSAAAMTSSNPTRRYPAPIATAAAIDMSSPTTVR